MKKILILVLLLITGIAQAQVTPTELMGLGMAPALSSKVASIGNGSRVRASAGTAALPSYSFSNNTSVGLYSVSENVLGVSIGGVGELALNATELYPITANGLALGTSALPFGSLSFTSWLRGGNGTATAPVFSFANETNTGIYKADTGQITISISGAIAYFMSANTLAPFADATRELGQLAYRFTNGNFSAYVRTGVSATVSAAGSALADSTLLANANNIVTTVAASTGVKLPASGLGSRVRVMNLGANDLKLYPNVATGNINSAADGIPITLAAATDDIAECVLYNSGSDLWSCARYAGPAS